MAKKPVNIPRYCYDFLFENGIKYTSGDSFSPNNIKRVILSPDGFAVQLHVGSNLIFKLFDTTYAGQCYYHEKYKPMFSALATDLVCSNVEEVIFCKGSLYNLYLPQSELDFRSIISNNKIVGNEKVLRDEIIKRFPRLRYVSIIDASMQELIQATKEILQSPTGVVSESKDLPFTVSQKIEINKDDWYKVIRLRPANYKLDMAGGALEKKLTGIRDKIEKDKQASRVAEIKNNRIGKYKDNVESVERKLQPVLSCYIMLRKIASGNSVFNGVSCEVLGKSNFSNSDFEGIPNGVKLSNYESILNSRLIKDLNRIGITVEDAHVENLDENIKTLCGQLNLITKQIYSSLVFLLCKIIKLHGENYPVMTKVRLSNFDRVIYVPNEMQSAVASILEFIGEPFQGSSIKDSIANICSLICSFVYCDVTEEYATVKKYNKKEAWLHVIDRDSIA